MANRQRDDFSEKTATDLAKRAAYRCSNPNCRAFTIGPAKANPGEYIYAGVAAHITAASKGGPRYDDGLTPEKRRHITNGIHLCGTCSIKIDKNSGRDYSVAMLQQWKKEHEGWVRKQATQNPEQLFLDVAEQAVFGYARDFQALRRHTQFAIDALARHSYIETGDARVSIERECNAVLLEMARSGPLLLTGEPGAGKSGATYQVAEALLAEGADIVAFATDQLAAESVGELRDELNLSHEVVDVLERWPGDKPGIIIIDALDAARAEPIARALRDLIRAVRDTEQLARWHVVASIRKFDLRNSPDLRRLFVGEGHTRHHDPEFSRVRHINVEPLSDAELRAISLQSESLSSLLTIASAELKQVLRNPFNLRLAGDLLAEGLAVGQLAPMQTQIELLDRYWLERVTRKDGLGTSRELLLERVTHHMIATRTLFAEKREILGHDAALATALDDLLRVGVLAEWQPTPDARPEGAVVRFPHHVLCDYAISRTLRGLPVTVVKRLESDRALIVSIRPSIALHFQYLWERDPDRTAFWEAALALAASPTVPEVGKLIAPAVATRYMSQPRDYRELVRSTVRLQRDAIPNVAQHLSVAAATGERPLTGGSAAPWATFIEEATRSESRPLILALCPLLRQVCNQSDQLSPSELGAAGVAARRFLAFAWRENPPNTWLVRNSIEFVCKTVRSSPEESGMALQPILEADHLKKHGFEEVPQLTMFIEPLIEYAPDFAAQVYKMAFAHEEQSDEKTSMGTLVVPMSSTRRQDYHLALYRLAEAFPAFLKSRPEHAARTVIQIYETHEAVLRDGSDEGEFSLEHFAFGGEEACVYVAKYSWSYYRHPHWDEEEKLVNGLCEHLASLSQSPNDKAIRQSIVGELTRKSTSAHVWAKLMEHGAKAPDGLGLDLSTALTALPLLLGNKTSRSAQELLQAVFPLLPSEERAAIERKVLALVGVGQSDEGDWRAGYRDRLLSALRVDLIVLPETKEMVARLEAAGGAHADNGSDGISLHAEWVSDDWGSRLTSEGVSIDEPANQRILDSLGPVEAYCSALRNEEPNSQASKEVFPQMLQLHQLLDDPSASERIVKSGWTTLAEASGIMTRTAGFDCASDVGSFVLESLLIAAAHPSPVYDPKYESGNARSFSWGASVRVNGAIGLMRLAAHPTCTDRRVFEAIEALTADPVSAVRFQVASMLTCLYHNDRERMWNLLSNSALSEPNMGVLNAVVSTCGSLANADTPRIVRELTAINARLPHTGDAGPVRDHIHVLFAQLAVWRNDPAAVQVVATLVKEPIERSSVISEMIYYLRDALTFEDGDPVQSSGVRRRATDFYYGVTKSAWQMIDGLETSNRDVRFSDWPDTERQRAIAAYEVLEHVGSYVYFASGAFDDKRNNGLAESEAKAKLSPVQMERFLHDQYPCLELLTRLGAPGLAFRLLEFCEHYVPVDPEQIFDLVHLTVVAGAERSGFHIDSLAADCACRIATTYLAEYPDIVRHGPNLVKLVDILDRFVQAGWPSAARLSYQLDDLAL